MTSGDFAVKNGCVPGIGVADLIAKLEAAEVGSGALDAAVFQHHFDHRVVEGLEAGEYSYEREPGWFCSVPSYTTSIDAALGLAEQQLPGWTWLVRGPDKDGRHPTLNFARVASPDYESVTWEAGDKVKTDHIAGTDGVANAHSPALAMCIAVLKACAAVGDK